jgi:cytochrome P450
MAPWLTSVDCLQLQRYVTVPMLLGGSVSPNPRFWPGLVRRETTASMIQFLRGVRRKYGPRAWSWFPVRSTLFVLDRAGIDEVLRSETIVADPWIKKCQLSTFTPRGVIISRKSPWSPRRQLNEDALAYGHPQHPDGDTFVTVAHDEVEKILDARREVLVWDDFRTLGVRISQQVIFGRGTYCEDLARRRARLVAASNLGLRRSGDFRAFYRHIDEQLKRQAPERPSLVQGAERWLAGHQGAAEAAVSSQIAFWLFVIQDAIELHAVRTLALIASAPDGVRRRLLLELNSCKSLTAGAMAELHFLEACIKETLRLWTPVPILLRVAAKRTELQDGVCIDKKRQILVHTGFYHRDPEVFGVAADRFMPEQRVEADRPDKGSVTSSSPPLYVFSRHHQSCVGESLILFLLKAVLARLLIRTELVLLDQAVAMDPVPAAIDHFALRFWRR